MTYEKAAVEHRGNPDGREDGQFRLTRFVPIGIVFAGLAFGYAMGLHEFLTLDFLAASRTQLKTYVADNFALSLATFFFVYVFAVAFSFPAASVLTIFAGFLFGWFIAGTVVAFAATAGATLLFLAARFAFADFFRFGICFALVIANFKLKNCDTI